MILTLKSPKDQLIRFTVDKYKVDLAITKYISLGLLVMFLLLLLFFYSEHTWLKEMESEKWKSEEAW